MILIGKKSNILKLSLKGTRFFYLLLLNVISNAAIIFMEFNWLSLFLVISVSFVAAYIENAIILLSHNKNAQKVVMAIWVGIHNVLIFLDYYLIFQFGRIFNQDIVDILFETNAIEIKNFTQSYLTYKTVFFIIAIILIFNVILFLLSKLLSKLRLTVMWGVGVLIGISIYIFMIYNYVKYKDGMGITQYNTMVRVSHSFMILSKTLAEINELTSVCTKVNAKQTVENSPIMVLIIGESASVYHSSLYGYEKNTTPLISKRVQTDSLIVFNDFVSVADGTHKAMESIFSLGSLRKDFSRYPLLPSCFKSAGYHVSMYDNQYFEGQGVTFLSDKKLSNVMFDFRNKKNYQFDGEMVNDIKVNSNNTLYIIHLWGQHYTYEWRYPKSFTTFKPEEYDSKKHSLEQRSIMAHYDNATLYNDFVLNEIIKKFESLNSCIVYLSDHGEEVFELGDFMGHGGAGLHKNIDYQIRVPFWIWTSDEFKKRYPDVCLSISRSSQLPGITDDVSHLLLDIAGIDTEMYDSSRSIINKDYNSSKPRIVLNSIKYEKK